MPPHLLLFKDLQVSSKWTAPTDNMRPMLHDEMAKVFDGVASSEA